ncbi:MAG: TetR/AcrR family transcriptional regulator [Micavibrio aeruginosavorus]|uniref:TetR/AcrR family transcriptional regulator n=1 Tax=Micavibrio aeruginosavorus TaxID=349221 RepID=A0A2W5A0V6_9BACT|nr:MAG: TetR/AcrR family transcriptional regulator [Micavibrio aeruginosavorus]
MARPDTGTRQKLIDTATDLLWTSSYGAVSVDDICNTADVKKGSFYHYFTSKLELATTAMEEYYEAYVRPDMEDIFSEKRDFASQIAALADSIVEEQHEVRNRYGLVCGCPMAALASEMIGEENASIAAKIEEMFDNCKGYIRAAIAKANANGTIHIPDVDAKTEEIHDFITELMIMARIHNNLDGLERDLRPGLIRILGLDEASPKTLKTA